MRVGWLLVLGACGRFGFDSVALGDANGNGDVTGNGDTSGTDDGNSPSLCGGSSALMCDGFEGPLNARWAIDAFHGEVAIETNRAYRGGSSAHFHTDVISVASMDPRMTIYTYDGLPVTGTVYTRVWAYFASPNPTTYFDQILNFADTAGTGLSFGARNGFIVDNDYATLQYAQSNTTHLPVDRWTCLQLELPSGALGTARLSVDGFEVADAAIVTSAPQPAPDHIYVGLEWIGNISSQAAVDAWLDELIIDNKPITCSD